MIEEFQKAADFLLQAKVVYADAARELAGRKAILEHVKITAMVEGVSVDGAKTLYSELGKNEAERQAKFEYYLRQQALERYLQVEDADDNFIRSKLALELAQLDWDLARYKLRLLEVMKHE